MNERRPNRTSRAREPPVSHAATRTPILAKTERSQT